MQANVCPYLHNMPDLNLPEPPPHYSMRTTKTETHEIKASIPYFAKILLFKGNMTQNAKEFIQTRTLIILWIFFEENTLLLSPSHAPCLSQQAKIWTLCVGCNENFSFPNERHLFV